MANVFTKSIHSFAIAVYLIFDICVQSKDPGK